MSEAGYDPAFFATLEAVEDRHFWFRARKKIVGRLVRQLTSRMPRGCRVLELGCGNGGMLSVLREASRGGSVIGMDRFADALRRAKRRCECNLVQGDVRFAPFDAAFHVVGMFDVLEHVAQDEALLRDVRRLLLPAGAVVITVPAHMSLWSYFDRAAHHARRYSEDELRIKLDRAGFVVEYITQFMGAIYPLVWLGRNVKQILGGRSAERMTHSELRVVPILNGLLGAALSGEEKMISQRRKITRGTSILAVARRRA